MKPTTIPHKQRNYYTLLGLLLILGFFFVQCGGNQNDSFQRSQNDRFLTSNSYLEKVLQELQAGNRANLNKPNEDGDYPIHLATREGKSKSPNIIKYLLKEGADVDAKDSDEETALHICLSKLSKRYNDYNDEAYKILKLLLKNGADVNAKNGDGETALLCWNAGNLDSQGIKILKLLLENGADVNEKKNGNTILMYLLKEQSSHEKLPKVVKAILATDRVDFEQKSDDDKDLINEIILKANFTNNYHKILEEVLKAWKRKARGRIKDWADRKKGYLESIDDGYVYYEYEEKLKRVLNGCNIEDGDSSPPPPYSAD